MSRTHQQSPLTYPVPGQARPLSEQQAHAIGLADGDQLVSNYLGSYPRGLTYSTISSLLDRGLLTEGPIETVTVRVCRYQLTETGQTAADALAPLGLFS